MLSLNGNPNARKCIVVLSEFHRREAQRAFGICDYFYIQYGTSYAGHRFKKIIFLSMEVALNEPSYGDPRRMATWVHEFRHRLVPGGEVVSL